MGPEDILNSLKCVVDSFADDLSEDQLDALRRCISWATANCFTEGGVDRQVYGILKAGGRRYERVVRGRSGSERLVGPRWKRVETRSDDGGQSGC